MKHARHTEQTVYQRPSFWKTPFGIAAAVVAVVASAYVYLDHQGHAKALLPFLLLAACPLMHVFMHRGHGGHGGHGGNTHVDQPAEPERSKDRPTSG